MSNPMDAPININLDGSFVIPRGADRYVAGEINPDIRLEHLDAFLQQLNSNMGTRTKEGPTLSSAMEKGFAEILAQAAKRLKADVVDAASCLLQIKVKIDPKDNSMVYDFALKLEVE